MAYSLPVGDGLWVVLEPLSAARLLVGSGARAARTASRSPRLPSFC
jgi:hypothetical protein